MRRLDYLFDGQTISPPLLPHLHLPPLIDQDLHYKLNRETRLNPNHPRSPFYSTLPSPSITLLLVPSPSILHTFFPLPPSLSSSSLSLHHSFPPSPSIRYPPHLLVLPIIFTRSSTGSKKGKDLKSLCASNSFSSIRKRGQINELVSYYSSPLKKLKSTFVPSNRDYGLLVPCKLSLTKKGLLQLMFQLDNCHLKS